MRGRRSGARSGAERVFLGLGSNVGRRPDNLRRALRFLRSDPQILVVRASFLYKTSPVGYTAQREFLNGVVEIRTPMAPAALLERLQGIEKSMGKQIVFPGGPRIIDMDLLLFGKRVTRSRRLSLPHPRLHLRRFVLAPLAEIAPRVVHPLLGKTAARLLAECDSTEGVAVWGPWRA